MDTSTGELISMEAEITFESLYEQALSAQKASLVEKIEKLPTEKRIWWEDKKHGGIETIISKEEVLKILNNL